MRTHTLKIISLHDAQAECSCGKWTFAATGAMTREQVTEEWSRHAERPDAGAETAHTKRIRETRATIRAEAEAVTPWTPDQANGFTSTARREYFEHSYQHGRRRDPDNCAACALQVLPEPNYSGWIRVYIQAGIRPNTKAAFKEIERARTENALYFAAILRDIATYKPRFIYPPNHEWTDNEKAQAGEKF